MYSARPLALSLAALLAALLVAHSALAAPNALARTRRQLADDNTLQPLDSGATWRLPAYTASTSRTREASPSSNRRLGSPSVDTQGTPTSDIRSDPTSPGIRSGLKSSNTRSTVRARSASALSTRVPRQATAKPTDDIPVFDRNKVSLDFPGNLFGPSVSLLIRTTKIVGDVIQNSAVRYQSFLRLFRPLFRGPFEIKGLDPPTTTTSTRRPSTSASTATPPASDNEINRRR